MSSWDPSDTMCVKRLVAGANVTLSPASGQGIVTVNASGGGGPRGWELLHHSLI